MKKLLFAAIALVFITACQLSHQKSEQKPSFTNKELKLTSDVMTPEVLWSFGRIGDIAVSPDEQTVLFSVSYTKIDENRTYTDLYTVPATGGEIKQITNTYANEIAATWLPDGNKIAYMSAASGEMQLWEMNPDGSKPVQITFVKGGINGFLYSPVMDKLIYTADVKLDSTANELYPDLPLANARIETDIMYRHWDTWEDESYSHVFVVDYKNASLSGNARDIMPGERYDAPLKPFGGMEQICWTNDGKKIAYTCKKLTGKAYALSTNSDIYLYDLESGTTTNLTEGMMGYDMVPVFSPDGTKMAFESMARDGYEADKVRIMIRDMSSGEIKDYSTTFDQNTHNMVWSKDGESIWFISDFHATDEIYKLSLNDVSINKITEGVHNYTWVVPAGDKLIASKVSMSQPKEIYIVDPQTGSDTNISLVNQNSLKQLTMGKVESRWIPTTDGKQMLTWVIYPPHFDPSKKYPAILYCEGGPQSTVSQFWSLRWNFQMMAANGYIVVAPNRRGLPGFGSEWNEQISGDYGGQNMKDYLSAIDALAKEPFVDAERLGAVGASYGGFSVFWLAGNHNKRFKAFISHCGIFNFEQMYVTTEEMFFVDWDYKGAFWDKNNKIAQRSYDNSPHKFIGNWDTPILVIHGEKDYRIPYTQGMGAFNAAVLRGIPARFVSFPEENHWVLSAQNGILWQREFAGWLDRWLK
jgi:dipeptidyl aminopeptidase/acylaminoacyl peptidase